MSISYLTLSRNFDRFFNEVCLKPYTDMANRNVPIYALIDEISKKLAELKEKFTNDPSKSLEALIAKYDQIKQIYTTTLEDQKKAYEFVTSSRFEQAMQTLQVVA